jgi:indolepyruvate ferredoxin oxidoreductase beta subunit
MKAKAQTPNSKLQISNHGSRNTEHGTRNTDHASRITHYDIYLVGVGGQGVLTIGDLIAEAALRNDIPVSFYPTKGMAQRGGAVKARVRLGREGAGPNIPEKGADLVIAMEVSEALKAVRFIKTGGDFVLFGHVWPPTAVMLGKAPYPALDQVLEQVRGAGASVHYLDPKRLPLHEGAPVPANIYVLGVAIGHTGLGQLLPPSELAAVMQAKWAKGAERNDRAFRAGLEAEG